MISAAIGDRLKVTGSSIAIVATGPMPGSTPISVPSRQPIRHMMMLNGTRASSCRRIVTACSLKTSMKPIARLPKMPSMVVPVLPASGSDRLR